MRVLVFFLIGLCAQPGLANTLIGDWTCREFHPDGGIVSSVSFLKSGRFKATMRITYKEAHTPRVDVRVRYRSRYEVRDGRLYDSPTSVRIEHFTLDGVAAGNHPLRAALRKELLDNGDSVALSFDGPDRMTLVRDEGAPIDCTRPVGQTPTS